MAKPSKFLLIVKKKGRNDRAKQTPPFICMVPSVYRDRKPSCFDPQVVSIGPLHRAHINVQELEGLKATYLHDLLARNSEYSPPKQTMEACLWKVLSSIDRIKLCYAGLKKYSDSELATMMVTGACFIVEFIQKCSECKDLRWGNPLVICHIIPDLVLQENQIPFFVLQNIFDCTLPKNPPGSSLISLSLLREHVLYKIKPFEARLEIPNPIINISSTFCTRLTSRHVSSQRVTPRGFPFAKYDSSPVTISHSALDLHLAGVVFKKKKTLSLIPSKKKP